MKKVIYSILMGILGSAAIAQTTEMRPVTDFNKLDVSGVARVKLTQGENISVKVEADEKTMKNIIVVVKDNKLIIKTEGEIDEEFTVYVNYKSLEEISASGATNVSTENTLNSTKLNVITSGATKASLDVVLKDIQTNASGASTLILSGATETHTAEVSGAASLKANKLSSLNTEINTSGAANAKINVNKKLTASASGASSIRYSGQPAETNVSAGKASTIEGIGTQEGNLKLNDIDTTRIKFGKKKYIIIDEDHHKRKFSYTSDFNHWAGVDLGINAYVGKDGNVSLPSKYDYMSVNYGLKSLVWNLNLFEKDFHIYKNYVNIVTGLGFSFNAYQFKNKTNLNTDSSFIGNHYDSAVSYSINKLKMSYVQMPLLLEFNTSSDPNKAFHIAAGVIGGYKLTSKTKQEYTLHGYEFDVKKKADYNINPFKLDATVRVGYGAFTVFGTYSLTTMFEKNKGPELYPFTVGLRVIPF